MSCGSVGECASTAAKTAMQPVNNQFAKAQFAAFVNSPATQKALSKAGLGYQDFMKRLDSGNGKNPLDASISAQSAINYFETYKSKKGLLPKFNEQAITDLLETLKKADAAFELTAGGYVNGDKNNIAYGFNL